ncbi:MAG: ATP-binding cassette domain-containing protein [Spirochaetaceae bacterium]|jgi:molybdate transport system ATP-binding protein|nr:ATP-binding cassette domain-containing protein [Spirochaetaceae bacterium]
MIICNIQKKLSKNFSLNISFKTSGEFCLGILGASGSGKSMILKCIAGIEKPDKGFISIDDSILFDSEKKINLKPQERRTGYLFQNYALFPTMSVLENIIAPLNFPRETKLKTAHYWMEKLDLCGLEQNLPGKLSGGQQQRVAIARMLICKPKSVLFDEPFSALDTNLREYMQLEFTEFLRSGVFSNAILVTHSRNEAFKLCNEIIIIDNGNIIIQGDSQTVFQNPQTVRAAEITGCKNISRIRRISEKEIDAIDWGIKLYTHHPVYKNITHAGIRAHNIMVADSKGYNEIDVNLIREIPELFETTVIFVNSSVSGAKEIYWKHPRNNFSAGTGLPQKLFFPPESILLLSEIDS